MKTKIMLCIISLLLPSLAYSAEIYVDNQLASDCTTYDPTTRTCGTGSDRAHNWIEEAISYVVNSGKMGTETFTIRVMDGTYYLPQSTPDYNEKIGIAVHQLVGTADHPITIRAHNITWPPSAILRFRTEPEIVWNDNPALINTGQKISADEYANYLTIDGFELIGRSKTLNNDGIGNTSGGGVPGRTITVRNCKIHDFRYGGIRGAYTWIVEYCEIYDIGTTHNHHCIYITKNGTGGNNNSIIRYNIFHDVRGWGVLPYDSWAGDHPNGLQMYGNICYNLGTHAGGGGGLNISGDNYKVYGNTIFNTRHGIRLQSGSDSADVRNNIIYEYEYLGIYFENLPTNAIIKYNLVYSGHFPNMEIKYGCTDCTISDNILGQDPQFVNVVSSDYATITWPDKTWTDFRLKSSSPAIDSGDNSLSSDYDEAVDPNELNWPPTKLDQDNYGVGREMGAFVFREIGSKPASVKWKDPPFE